MASLAEPQRSLATGYFTTIRRSVNGDFSIVPYSLVYQSELRLAAHWLRSAAGHTQQPTLKDFLTKRADAFLSNDYYDSDIAWRNLGSSIEPTIGPYEVYEDAWFGFKAAFESFVTIKDEAESAKLARFSGELQGLENTLPIDAKRMPRAWRCS